MKKYNISLALLCMTVSLLLQIVSLENAFGVDKAAEEAMIKAQETISVLEKGIEHAGEVLQQIKERGTANEYRVALEIKEEAERMLSEALKHKAAATDIAEDFNSAPTDTVANALSYTSRAEAETARTYAKLGLLFLKALQFAAERELECVEQTNAALRDKQRTWSTMEKVVVFADESLQHANSAMNVKETAAEEAAMSTDAAKKCIALARELNLLLDKFEDICNDFIKEWRRYKDYDDDEEPSPI